jgi:uncharacterized protein (DUF1697 family)
MSIAQSRCGTAYVVLLRGVNVGKAQRVPMAEFKQVLLDLGCTHAATILNSGNAVVQHSSIDSRALATRIAQAVEGHFGFSVPVIVKSAVEFDEVVSGKLLELAETDHPRLLVAFAQSKESIAALDSLASLVAPPERFQMGRHAAYLYCASGILQSKAANALLGKFGRAVTTRNWATVLKLHALAGHAAPHGQGAQPSSPG